jgi:hypothetical protein
MNNMKNSRVFIVIILLMLSFALIIPSINGESTTIVSIDDVDVPKGGSNWIQIEVKDVVDLGSCDVSLSWNPDVVEVKSTGDSDFDSMVPYLDNVAGVLNVIAHSLVSMNGNFTLANITFKSSSSASIGDKCDLEIIDSLLLTADPTPVEINHININGIANIITSSNDDDDNGNSGGGGGSTNIPPIADASASQTDGFIGESIIFDGSLSSDSDGTITNYTWKFDDDTKRYGKTTIHIFSNIAIYNVILLVTDNQGATNEDTISVTISKANNPPSKPNVEGPIHGNKNTEYSYTAVSTDIDNDTIRYSLIWGDETSYITESGFLPSGSVYIANHSWRAAGEYKISVKADDNETESGVTIYTVYIDVLRIDDEIIGYFIDNDSDEIYDSFENSETGITTDISSQDYITYLIDSDADGEMDYVYNVEVGLLTEYAHKKESENNAVWYALGLGMLIVLIVLFILFQIVKKKKGN